MNQSFLTSQISNESLNSKNDVLISFTPWKQPIFSFSCFFKKHDFQLNNLLRVTIELKKDNASKSELKKIQRVLVCNSKSTTRQISKKKFYILSDVETIFHTRVRFWIECFKTCHMSSVLLLLFAKFSCVHQNKAPFGNFLMFGVGSVSQVIPLGQVSCTPSVINVTRHFKTANLIQVCSSIYLDREWYLTMFH